MLWSPYVQKSFWAFRGSGYGVLTMHMFITPCWLAWREWRTETLIKTGLVYFVSNVWKMTSSLRCLPVGVWACTLTSSLKIWRGLLVSRSETLDVLNMSVSKTSSKPRSEPDCAWGKKENVSARPIAWLPVCNQAHS